MNYDDAEREAHLLRDEAEGMVKAFERLKRINQTAMDIATEAVNIAPIGVLHPQVLDFVESTMDGCRQVMEDVGKIIDDLKSSETAFDYRISQLRQYLDTL